MSASAGVFNSNGGGAGAGIGGNNPNANNNYQQNPLNNLNSFSL